jgi:hypothetical protein
VEVEAPKITGWGPKAISARFKQAFLGADGKLDKAKLASVGGSFTLSYGFISNLNAFSLLMIAWYLPLNKQLMHLSSCRTVSSAT